jgi:hypothetical protein
MNDKCSKARDEKRYERCIGKEGFARYAPGVCGMTDASEAYKALFCRTFIDTHRDFEPADLPWPNLDAKTIDRLSSIPFWTVALASESNAGYMVSAFAETLEDPLLREAMALQGKEETRHARLLYEMLRRYGIPFEPPKAAQVKASSRAFIDFGYEECIDSFFGFGIFGLARRIQLFVPELTDIFEVVLLEEARHVTFFVNWIAYDRRLRGRAWAPLEAASTALGYARALRRIVTTFAPSARNGQKVRGTGFAAEGTFAVFDGVTWRTFLQACLTENERYLRGFDPRLLTPRVLPVMARMALSLPSRPRFRRSATRSASPRA